MNNFNARLQLLIPILICFTFWGCNSNDTKSTEQAKTSNNEEVNSNPESEVSNNQKVILFFGNSLTAGYGLDLSESFPMLIQKKVDSLGYNYKVINAGLSGETTSGGSERVDWVMKQQVDVFVLELGGNDGLRGIPLSETKKNLQEIINIVREKSPKATVMLAGMQIPPNMGQEYITEFQEIYPSLAEQNNLVLIPFLLEGVAGDPNLNLEDGIHPNKTGQKIVASTVWEYLEPLLGKDF